MGEILILENNVSEGLQNDSCDILDDIIRCKECFKSFNSNEDLITHLECHRKSLFHLFKDNNIPDSKLMSIRSSKYPIINISPVSLTNHPPVKVDKFTRIETKLKDADLSANISKVTTLQALDDLMAPKRNTKALGRKSLGQSNLENSSNFKGVSMTDKVHLKSKSSIKVDDVQSGRNIFTCKVCL